jgi:hypothetical protein
LEWVIAILLILLLVWVGKGLLNSEGKRNDIQRQNQCSVTNPGPSC